MADEWGVSSEAPVDPWGVVTQENSAPSATRESSAPQWMKTVSAGVDRLPSAFKTNPITGPMLAPIAALPETYDFGKEALHGLYEAPGKLGASFSNPESATPPQMPGSGAFLDQKESFKQEARKRGMTEDAAEMAAQTLVQRMQRGEALQSILFGVGGLLAAPAMGAYRHYVSQPLEDVGGPPRDVTEMGTMIGLGIPGAKATLATMPSARKAAAREAAALEPPAPPVDTTEAGYTSPVQERPGSGVRILPRDYPGHGDIGDPNYAAAWDALGQSRGAGAAGVPGGPLAGMHPKAIELAREIFNEEGLSPWERERRIEEMSPHQFGAEWSDSSRMAVSGLHRKGGEPATIIGPAFRGRKSETPERIAGHFDEMFGDYKNMTEDQARIDKERDALSKPFWKQFNQTPVSPTPRLNSLRDALETSGAWSKAERLLRIGQVPREQHFVVNGKGVKAPTAQFYQAVKQALDMNIASALKNEQGTEAMYLVGLKHKLINAINEHPDQNVAGKWKMALDTWAGPEAMKSAQDLGYRLLTQHVKARDINEILSSYGERERGEIGVGIREYLEERLGNPGNVDLGVINTVLAPNNLKKLKAIYGEEPVDRFARIMHHEHDMHFAHDRITRNSVTTESANAAKRFEPKETWAQSHGPGDLPHSTAHALSMGVKKLWEKKQEKSVQAALAEQGKINADVARVMTLQGPERNAVIRFLTGGEAPEAPAAARAPAAPPVAPGEPVAAAPAAPPPGPEAARPVAQFVPHANAEEASRTLLQYGWPQEEINKTGGAMRMATADALRQAYPNGPPPKPVAEFPYDREARMPPEPPPPSGVPEWLTGKQESAPKPLSLLEFIVKNGGISPDDPLIGDVRGIFGGKNPRGIIRKGGKTLDQMREAAVGEKYFIDQGDIEGREASTNINTLLDAMEREARGEKQFRVGEEPPEARIDPAQMEYEQAQRHELENGPQAQHFDRELSRFDVTPDMIAPNIRLRALEIMTHEGERDPVAAYDRALDEEFSKTGFMEGFLLQGEGEDPFSGGMAPSRSSPAPGRQPESGATVRAAGRDHREEEPDLPLRRGGRATSYRGKTKNNQPNIPRPPSQKNNGGRVSNQNNFANGGRVDPDNIHSSPTEAQKKAGNYAKDHVRIHGMDITIENAKGSKRSGVDKGGKKWEVSLPAHYGYIKGSVGADKDHVDVYFGPHAKSPHVFVIDQQDADSKKFDEHKCFIGFASKAQVIKCYNRAFSDGRASDRMGAIHEMGIPAFKDWLASGDTTKAMSKAA